jgi:hypothetical protein
VVGEEREHGSHNAVVAACPEKRRYQGKTMIGVPDEGTPMTVIYDSGAISTLEQ